MASAPPDTPQDTLIERLYDLMSTSSEGRTCDAIPESACRKAPGNFVLNVLSGSATKLAEQLAGPGLVLAWLFAAIGVPIAFAGLLVPISEAGSLLPQLSVAGRIRTFATRKEFWVVSSLIQAAALALMIPAALLTPIAAGVVILLLLTVSSVASGVGSVAFKDVLGKTIPRGRRGALLATRATAGGLLATAAGLLIRRDFSNFDSLEPYLVLLALAAILWLVGALFFVAIQEEPGATSGGRNGLQEAAAGLRLLRDLPGFRRFMVARALLMSVPLAIPFYALYGKGVVNASFGGLGAFVIANGLATVLSSPIWGGLSDRSSRQVMFYGGILAAAGGALALFVGLLPEFLRNGYLYAPVFLVVGFANAGIRLGRQTYIIDGAPEQERPLYVALSNTLIGVVTLVGAGLGLVADALGLRAVMLMLIVLSLLGSYASYRMPEALTFKR